MTVVAVDFKRSKLEPADDAFGESLPLVGREGNRAPEAKTRKYVITAGATMVSAGSQPPASPPANR